MSESQLILVGVAQGLFLAFMLWQKMALNAANRFLIILILVLTGLIWSGYLHDTGGFQSLPHLVYVFEPLKMLIAPCFYLYIRHSLGGGASRKVYWHGLPALLLIIGLLPFYLLPATEKLAYVGNLPEAGYLSAISFIEETFFQLGFVIQFFAYWWLSVSMLKRHQELIRQRFSNIEGIDFKWLMILSYGLLLCFFAFLFDQAVMLGEDLCYSDITCALNFQYSGVYFAELAIVLCFYLFSILALKQRALTSEEVKLTVPQPSEEDIKQPAEQRYSNKYQNSPLDFDQAKMVYQAVKEFITESMCFTEADLTLDQLAEKVGVTRHHLSQAINQAGDKHFFDFINEYRIEHAKGLLLSDGNPSILDASVESGFNSRSAFNKAFKQYTDQTPSQYRKTHREQG